MLSTVSYSVLYAIRLFIYFVVCLPRVQRVEGILQQRPEGCQVFATSCPVVAVPTHLLLHSPTCSHPTPLFHTGRPTYSCTPPPVVILLLSFIQV
jgi:hypothetical protein